MMISFFLLLLLLFVRVSVSVRTLWTRAYWMNGMCAHSWRLFHSLSRFLQTHVCALTLFFHCVLIAQYNCLLIQMSILLAHFNFRPITLELWRTYIKLNCSQYSFLNFCYLGVGTFHSQHAFILLYIHTTKQTLIYNNNSSESVVHLNYLDSNAFVEEKREKKRKRKKTGRNHKCIDCVVASCLPQPNSQLELR